MAIGDNALYGYESHIGIGQETTYGTEVTVSAFMEFKSESLLKTREEIKIDEINKTRNPIKRLLGNESVEGTIEGYLNVATDSHVFLIKQAFGGTVSANTIVASCVKHTLYEGNMENNKGTTTSSDVKSLTIKKWTGGDTWGWIYAGCRVNSMTIKGEIGQPISITYNIVGKSATSTAQTLTTSFTDALPLHFTGVQISNADNIGSISSATSETFVAFELTLNNNLLTDTNARKLGSDKLVKPFTGMREVSLKLTQRFDTVTAYNRFNAETPLAFQLFLDSGQTVSGAGAGATTYSMLIRLPYCYHNSNMPAAGGPDVLIQDLELSCISKNTTTAYCIQADIVNGTANYH